MQEESIDMRVSDINQVFHKFPELEQLDFKTLKRYENYFDYIGHDYWRIALSQKYQKNWKLKSIALDEALSLEVREGLHVVALM